MGSGQTHRRTRKNVLPLRAFTSKENPDNNNIPSPANDAVPYAAHQGRLIISRPWHPSRGAIQGSNDTERMTINQGKYPMNTAKPENTQALPRAIAATAMTGLARKGNHRRARQRIRRGAVALGVSTILAGLSAGAAAASSQDAILQPAASSQDATLQPGGGKSFRTWFFGRTVICFTNLGPEVASYEWISSTTFSSRSLSPYQEYCISRAFVGFDIYVTNTSVTSSPIHVSFPYGP